MKQNGIQLAENLNMDCWNARTFTSAHFLFDRKKKVIPKSLHILSMI